MQTFRHFSVILTLFAVVGCMTTHDRPVDDLDHKPMSQRLGNLHNDGPRKRILLLPFLNESVEKDPAVTRTGRDVLVNGLRLTDNFIILDNGDVPKDLKQYQKDGTYDLDEIAKVAAEMGALAIVEGRILEIKARRTGDNVGFIRSVTANVQATVGVRVFSSLNHRELVSEVRSANSIAQTHRVADGGEAAMHLAADPELISDALRSAFQGMILPITKAVDKLTWGGRIALVSGDRVYVNAGRLTGLNVGDILRVSEDGEDVYDPSTGALIGKAPGRMKGTLEVVSYFGKDGAITVVHSGSGFKENDKVELY